MDATPDNATLVIWTTHQIARQIIGGCMEYRLVVNGEQFQDGDETLDDNCETWTKLGRHFLKCHFNPFLNVPVRRAISNKVINPTAPQ